MYSSPSRHLACCAYVRHNRAHGWSTLRLVGAAALVLCAMVLVAGLEVSGVIDQLGGVVAASSVWIGAVGVLVWLAMRRFPGGLADIDPSTRVGAIFFVPITGLAVWDLTDSAPFATRLWLSSLLAGLLCEIVLYAAPKMAVGMRRCDVRNAIVCAQQQGPVRGCCRARQPASLRDLCRHRWPPPDLRVFKYVDGA